MSKWVWKGSTPVRNADMAPPSVIRCTSGWLMRGACDVCISEVKRIGKPHYNFHRVGFFITPMPLFLLLDYLW